jgi:hypothetical protein
VRILLALALTGCGESYRERSFDCDAIADAYATGCPGHLGIAADAAACEDVRSGQNGVFAATIDRAAAVCEEVAADLATPASCDAIFVCVDDEHGLSAVTRTLRVTGTATVAGAPFTFDQEAGWAWLGTTRFGNPGDFEALFTAGGRPWYFRLDDLAERARTQPVLVDAARPIKLESSTDNLELTSGRVTVDAFAEDGAFELAAEATDPATGDGFDLRLVGSFAG